MVARDQIALLVFIETWWRSLLWRYPSLGHRTLNNVTLNPFAVRTSKRSQVLAQRARLNRRQPHWRTASRALRALVLCVEHVLLPQFGALSSPASHPTEADFMGSLATTSFCTKWQLVRTVRFPVRKSGIMAQTATTEF